MSVCRKWLLPVFACLVILGAVFLPPRLSQFKDGQAMGHVNTETLSAVSEISANTLTTAERIELLARWLDGSESLVSVSHPLAGTEELEDLEELVQAELTRLRDDGILSAFGLPDEIFSLSGTQLYLRDSQDTAGAGYLIADVYLEDEETATFMWLALDEESGYAMALELEYSTMDSNAMYPSEIGAMFLERLQLAYEPSYTGAYDAVFVLDENEIQYEVYMDGFLSVYPTAADWSGIADSEAVTNAESLDDWNE